VSRNHGDAIREDRCNSIRDYSVYVSEWRIAHASRRASGDFCPSKGAKGFVNAMFGVSANENLCIWT